MELAKDIKTTNYDICNIVILRALARIEARLSKKDISEVIADYKQQMEDLETFYSAPEG